MNLNPAERDLSMSSSRFNIQSRLSYGCQWIHASVSDTYQRSKSWLHTKLESEPIFTIRKKLDGAGDAVKTALGVHYIFDFGLALIPTTGPLYVGLTVTKYSFAGLTFAITAYTNQLQRQKYRDSREKLTALREVLTQIDKKLGETFRVIAQAEDLLKMAGFPQQEETSIQLEWENQEASSENISQLTHSTFFSSKCKSALKAGFNAGVRTAMVNYACETINLTSNVFKNMLLGLTMIVSLVREYERCKLDAESQSELNRLKLYIENAGQKIKFINKKLGSETILKDILEQAANVTHLPAHAGIHDAETPQTTTSSFLKFINSKTGCALNAVINGAAIGSTVHELGAFLFPTFTPLKLVLGASSWMAAIGFIHKQQKSNAVFNEQIKELDDKLVEAQKLLTLAEKILIHQREYVRQLGGIPITETEPHKVDDEKGADQLLEADFAEMALLSDSDYQLLEEGGIELVQSTTRMDAKR
jgi:hypothetical protein